MIYKFIVLPTDNSIYEYSFYKRNHYLEYLMTGTGIQTEILNFTHIPTSFTKKEILENPLSFLFPKLILKRNRKIKNPVLKIDIIKTKILIH